MGFPNSIWKFQGRVVQPTLNGALRVAFEHLLNNKRQNIISSDSSYNKINSICEFICVSVCLVEENNLVNHPGIRDFQTQFGNSMIFGNFIRRDWYINPYSSVLSFSLFELFDMEMSRFLLTFLFCISSLEGRRYLSKYLSSSAQVLKTTGYSYKYYPWPADSSTLIVNGKNMFIMSLLTQFVRFKVLNSS